MKKNKKFRLGIIGLGFVSQVAHLPAIKKNKKISLVCAAEKNNIILKKVGKKFNIKKQYVSYEEMINKEKLDGVVLSVQRNSTYKIAKYLIKKKIPLLSEKPAALNYNDANALVKQSLKNECKYFLGYMKIHDEGVKYVKAILKKKKLGELKSVQYKNLSGSSYIGSHNYFKQADNYIKKFSLNRKKINNKKNAFIKFLNSNCHSINLLRFFFDKIHISKNHLSSNGEGFVIFKDKETLISFNNIYSNLKNKWIEELDFYFQDGIVSLKLPSPLTKNHFSSIQIINFKNNKKYFINVKKKRSFENQIDCFLVYLKSKKFKHHCIAKNCLEDIKIISNLLK